MTQFDYENALFRYPRTTHYVQDLLEDMRSSSVKDNKNYCLATLDDDQKNVLIGQLILDIGHNLEYVGDNAALALAMRGSKAMIDLYFKSVKNSIIKIYNKLIDDIFTVVAEELDDKKIRNTSGYYSPTQELIDSDNRDRAAAVRNMGGLTCLL